jgi:hypothetical protein
LGVEVPATDWALLVALCQIIRKSVMYAYKLQSVEEKTPTLSKKKKQHFTSPDTVIARELDYDTKKCI